MLTAVQTSPVVGLAVGCLQHQLRGVTAERPQQLPDAISCHPPARPTVAQKQVVCRFLLGVGLDERHVSMAEVMLLLLLLLTGSPSFRDHIFTLPAMLLWACTQ